MAFAALGDSERVWELLQMISPVNHSKTAEDIATYKVEPYVMAADVYKVPSHLGRGGWTWYTGSAGWMYQAITGSVLGLKVAGNKLSFNPCITAEWASFTVDYRFGDTTYAITVRRATNGDAGVEVDGVKLSGKEIDLVDDRSNHKVVIDF